MPRRIPKNYFAADPKNNAYLPSEFEQTYDKLRASSNVEDRRGEKDNTVWEAYDSRLREMSYKDSK